MRLARYDGDRLALVRGDAAHDVSAALAGLPALRWPLPPGDLLIAHLDALRPALERAAQAADAVPLDTLALDAPVANPGKLIGAPVNYLRHVDEVRADPAIHHGAALKAIQDAGLFLKATSALAGPAQGITLGFPQRRTDPEVELAVVIGRTARHVARADALRHVAGYAIGLDVTVRGTEERSLRKSLDSYAVLGPYLVTADEVPDPGALTLWLEVNGVPRQRAATADMVWDVPRLIEYTSAAYTLHPGDVIYSGTPEGVGPVAPGDVIEAGIEGLCSMRVQVHAG